MSWRMNVALFAMLAISVPMIRAQSQKTLTNADIVEMTKEGFDSNLIVQEIQANDVDFDTSPQALINLKNAGVTQSVMQAMLMAQTVKPSPSVVPARATVPSPADGAAADPTRPVCTAHSGCLLRDGTEVTLKFAADLSSKTAHEGDPVEFLLDGDLKVGETVVVPKGAHAVATVSAAKKAGMMGKPGDLSVQLQYLIAGGNHVRLRGTKGKEGESKTGATVALTVLFGPIGLIKHGKDVDIPAGTPLTAYIDQDVWLPAVE
jgi:hypothetical protein